MKHITLRKFSEILSKLMADKGLSPKELATKSGISYSSLTPILSGSRDFGISKLIAIANALECTPDTLLNGLFKPTANSNKEQSDTSTKPKYIAVFISVISVTYCMLYDIASKNKTTSVLQFPLRCGQDPDEFLDHIITSIQKLSEDFTNITNNRNVAVFVSVQQFGRLINKKKIQQKGENLFAKFIIEADAITNHHALLGNKNGICISINDGNAITYTNDHGNSITKLQGYGFPISDIAGNYWIGCEAIKHTINVKEGTEPISLLSDKILALFNDDIDLLSECTMKTPEIYYSKASSLVKELMYKGQKSYEIVKKSADLLMQKIGLIDNEIKLKLPIVITGDLAHIYEIFFPENRLIKIKNRHINTILDYAVDVIKKDIKHGGK